MRFNINTDGLKGLTEKLKLLKRSALPAAINSTLNNAAFDVKQNTMLRSAKNQFVHRQQNFFKANSTVEKSTGFDINKMAATVGFKSLSGDNYAVDDLEQQEHGGNIDKKSFIPLDAARRGNSKKGLIKPNARLKSITKIIKTKDIINKSAKQRFVIAAMVAGKGGFVLKGDTLFRINTVVKTGLKSRKTFFNATPLYSFRKGRKVHVDHTGFMEKATVKTAEKLPEFYIKNAEHQLQKVWK